MENINPILKADYPCPDVIRVGDTYYMASMTVHFCPGGVILRSYDLVNWEIAGYVFDKLDGTPEQRLEGEKTNYSHGMWSPCLRYYNGRFVVSFGVPETGRTYFYTSDKPEGPWEKKSMEGYFHDHSLLFDEDGRVFIVHGNTEIWLDELEEDFSGLKQDGLHRRLLKDEENLWLGYEGSHFYKIEGRYYLFVIHWPKEDPARRTHMCFWADSLEEEFQGGEALCDDRGYRNQGVAQGGIVDTPEGNWYAILYQDHGAVGRIPVLVPVSWKDRMPVFGIERRIPTEFQLLSGRPKYRYEPLYTSDSFPCVRDGQGRYVLKRQWQWNHEPDEKLWSILPEGGLCIRTGKVSINLIHAVNTLTQRMMFPASCAGVTVDARGLKEGDFAGLCALQGCYGMIAVTKELNKYYLVVMARKLQDTSLRDIAADYLPGTVVEKIAMEGSEIRVKISTDFSDMRDTAEFFYKEGKRWVRIDYKHRLFFRMDHFMGCRYGLFVYATKESGGAAVFRDFKYLYKGK